MRKIIFLTLALLPLFSFSQEYSEVVQVEGKTADQLYASAKEWIAKTFVSANDVIQMDDVTAGKLIGKGYAEVANSYTTAGMMKLTMFITWKLNFTITIAVKDGRYKCDITDISVTQYVPGSQYMNDIKSPLSDYFKNKDFYKNATDPEWLFSNGDISGTTVSKSSAKQIAPIYGCYYKLIDQTDDKMKSIMLSLQQAMKTSEADW